MKFATLAFLVATTVSASPAIKQCDAIKSLAAGDTCLCDSNKP